MEIASLLPSVHGATGIFRPTHKHVTWLPQKTTEADSQPASSVVQQPLDSQTRSAAQLIHSSSSSRLPRLKLFQLRHGLVGGLSDFFVVGVGQVY